MIFIVIPAYNEADIIGSTLDSIAQAMAGVAEPWQAVVVDDGSGDGTPAVVEKAAGRMPVRLIRHEVNRGPGEAYQTGLKDVCATAKDEDVIFTIEADNTNDAKIMPAMLQELRAGADVVCGSRFAGHGRYDGFPVHRTLLSKGANHLLRRVFPIQVVTDYTIFFRAYRAACIKGAFDRFGDKFIESAGFVGNAEILIKLRSLKNLVAREVPLVYRYEHRRGHSHMKVVKNMIEYLRFLRRNWRLRSAHPTAR